MIHGATGYSNGMIITGLLLLLIGALTGVGVLWTAGIIVIIVGLVLMVLGRTGHRVGGRAHYW